MSTYGLPIVESLVIFAQIHDELNLKIFAIKLCDAISVDEAAATIVDRTRLRIGRIFEVELRVDREASHRVRLHKAVLDANPFVAGGQCVRLFDDCFHIDIDIDCLSFVRE